MVGTGVAEGARGILSKEAGAGLVVGGILSAEVEDRVGTDARLGWVLVVVVVEGQGCGTVTREGGV